VAPLPLPKCIKKLWECRGMHSKTQKPKGLPKKTTTSHTHTYRETKTTKRGAEKNCISGLSVA